MGHVKLGFSEQAYKHLKSKYHLNKLESKEADYWLPLLFFGF